MGNYKGKESLFQEVETLFIRAIGKMTNPMEEGFRFILMDQDIKDNFKMV